MSFKEFVKSLRSSQRVEGKLFSRFAVALGTVAAVFLILYVIKFQNIPQFWDKQGIYMVLAFLGYALLAPAIYQVRSYHKFACMAGMMIGMTLGMVSGYIAGFYVGATNGMFVGSVFGLLVGSFVGIMHGKCCGVMGFMEGIMAGLMAGPMGAMTAVMLFNDHLLLMGIILLAVLAIILVSLLYMNYLEMKSSEITQGEDNFAIFVYTLVLSVLTALLMMFGPRSPLFS